ncbi:unnamed protein product, partial [Meganyctiphanes norvegica]
RADTRGPYLPVDILRSSRHHTILFQSTTMRNSGFLFVLLALAGVATCHFPPGYHRHRAVREERKASCILQPSEPNTVNVTGIVEITQPGPNEPVFVGGLISVTTTNEFITKHGFHIHEFGVPNGDCAEAAGHYNPLGKDHGAPDVDNRHVGDLGNIVFTSVEEGRYNSFVQIHDSQATLFGDYNVVGRAIVLHEGTDDLGLGGEDDSLTTGHAGARIACCTINMVPV